MIRIFLHCSHFFTDFKGKEMKISIFLTIFRQINSHLLIAINRMSGYSFVDDLKMGEHTSKYIFIYQYKEFYNKYFDILRQREGNNKILI